MKLRYLINRDNPRDLEEQFKRIITVLHLPEIPLAKFDVDAFLALRTSANCMDFRDWLSHVSQWSAADIVDRVNVFKETIARSYASPIGKVFRLMVAGGLSLVPAGGWLFGLAQGFLENFVLEQALKPTGAITFIESDYPSVFGDTRNA